MASRGQLLLKIHQNIQLSHICLCSRPLISHKVMTGNQTTSGGSWENIYIHCTCTPLTTVFLATQNGGVVSRFLSIFHFMFGYTRYRIRSTTDLLISGALTTFWEYYLNPKNPILTVFFFFFCQNTHTGCFFFPLINVDSRKCSHGSALESSLLSLPLPLLTLHIQKACI